MKYVPSLFDPFIELHAWVCRLPGERLSIWLSVHEPGSPHGWAGFDALRPAELAEVLAQRPFIVLLGGAVADVQYLVNKYDAELAGGSPLFLLYSVSSSRFQN